MIIYVQRKNDQERSKGKPTKEGHKGKPTERKHDQEKTGTRNKDSSVTNLGVKFITTDGFTRPSSNRVGEGCVSA